MSKCLHCLFQNELNHKFCQKCGKKLLLQERYRAIGYLGEGGFGRTFKAIDHLRLNSPCVIKQFLPLLEENSVNSKAIELFNQEAKLLMELGKHPQIPDLFAFFEQDQKLYLVQEFIDGEDLLKEIEKKSIFSEEDIYDLLKQILPVLQFIHDKNVIHRDIKPENILRQKRNIINPLLADQKRDLVLIDFGVSRQLNKAIMTRFGTVVGTASYIAPEQNKGFVNFSSDLYSLAVTAIRLLTGCFPHEKNGTIIDEIFDIIHWQWKWKQVLHKKGIKINQKLETILDKMLQEKIGDRYQSATEILIELNSENKNISSPQILLNISPKEKINSSLNDSNILTFDLGNEIILEMIKIPSGEFLMGSPFGDGNNSEYPQHLVNISEFYLGKYPITQPQWQIIIGNNPAYFKEQLSIFTNQGVLGHFPVESVSWHDCQDFCQKLSQKTGKFFKLPSESQWEYACRAGATTRYYFGNSQAQLAEFAWYQDNSHNKIQSVGKKAPNNWGLYDLLGNVWEWCEDSWANSYHNTPIDGMAWEGNNQKKKKILRGGSWFDSALQCRCSNRSKYHPINKISNIGFRVVSVI